MAGRAHVVAPRVRVDDAVLRNASQRPCRAVSVVALFGGALAVLAGAWAALPGASEAFTGGGVPQLHRDAPDMASGVAMGVRSTLRRGGVPNVAEIARRKQSFPTLNNMKDQYFILWARSAKVRNWFPINIISGSEAAKTLKGVQENEVVKAVGADGLVGGQIVRAIGMNLYKQKDEVQKQAVSMHVSLKYAPTIEFGFKEILNNTEFNENPGTSMSLVNITKIPPEEELRMFLDDAGDAVAGAGAEISKVGDNIKGFFGGGNSR